MAETTNAVTPFTVTRFRCPTCRKTGSSRSKMQAHADTCIHNPNTKACATCGADAEHRVPTPDGYRIEHRCDKGARVPGQQVNLHCPVWLAKPEEAV